MVAARSPDRADSAERPAEPIALEPRGDAPPPLVFRRGARSPFAVRWFGITSLFGHTRNLIASAIAGEQIDSRDWMRPEAPEELLAAVLEALGGRTDAPTLAAGLGRAVWIDFVADTGDDRDVSHAVAKMIFAEYRAGDRLLPRGDLLVFGGDTAYPVGTVDEIHRRVVVPWNEVLRERAGEREARPRVVLAIPGNHDWYDGLDGFARLFRRSVHDARHGAVPATGDHHRPAILPKRLARRAGTVARQLHLDEVGGFFKLLRDLGTSLRAFWRGSTVARRKRLALAGYEPVQEATYWALPLAETLDAFGVDRQLRRLDFRQRAYFQRRRRERPDARLLFFAPDPAIAFGERWAAGQGMLRGCHVELADDPVLYMTGDMHHYERRIVAGGASMHVIAGGGGAFLHGTRIGASPGGPAACAYPDGATCRRLVAQVPLRLMLGGSGFLVHVGFGALASMELGAEIAGTWPLVVIAAAFSIALTVAFYANAGHNRAHPRKVLAVAVPFGTALGLLPMGLALALPRVVPTLAGDGAVILVYAFLGALGFGLFLMTVAILGLEHQQAYAVLSHPGFKHFVRMCVHPDGRVEAWTIGKDDPLAPGDGKLIDSFSWDGRRSDR